MRYEYRDILPEFDPEDGIVVLVGNGVQGVVMDEESRWLVGFGTLDGEDADGFQDDRAFLGCGRPGHPKQGRSA